MSLSTFRTSAGLLAAAVAITGATLAVETNPSAVVDAISSTTWVSSAGADAATRLGPGGAEVTIGLGDVGDHLQVVDLDGVAYAVDGNGRFSRIDPATFEVTVGAELPGVELVAGSGRLYALDREKATVTELDPVTLQVLTAPVEVGDEPGSAVVDDRGALWVLDDATGEVVRISGEDRSEPVAAVGAGTFGDLVVIDGQVVLVDPTEAVVTMLDADGQPGRRLALDPFDGDRVLVPSRVASGAILPILDHDRLVLVDMTGGNSRVVELDRAANRLGAPTVAAGFAHVPDLTAGVLVSVSLDTAEVTTVHDLDGVGDEFDVIAKGDFVYANDAANELAWVIGPDGTLTDVEKFDPNDPGTGDAPPPTVPPGPEPEEFPDTPQITTPETPEFPTPETPDMPELETPAPPAGAPPTVPDRTPVEPPSGAPGAPPDTVPDGGTVPDDSGPPACPDGGTEPDCTTTTQPCDDGYSELCPAPGDGAVGAVSATAGDATITANWSAPTDWYEVIGYSVTVVPYGDTPNAIGPLQLGPVDEHIQTSLRNGQRYYVVVEAIGEGGRRGSPVASALAMPISADPGRPRSVEATASGCTGIAVSWADPDDGFAVAGYRVDVTTIDGEVWSGDVSASTTSTTVPVDAVTFGSQHTVSVSSIDAAGALSPSADGGTVVPHCVPGAPGAVDPQASGDGAALVAWTPGAANGAAIDGHEIEYTAAGQPGGSRSVAGDATSATIDGLTNGSSYDVRVRSSNADGWGPWSPAMAVLIQSHTPDMPASFSATPQDGQVTLTWAVAGGNGTTVTGYTVENVTTGASVVVTGTTHTFTGLTNGAAYDVRVRANGANGNVSGWATAGPVIPAGAPGAPTSVVANPQDGAVVVQWSAPASGNGTTVAGYEVRVGGGTPQAASSPHTVTGLANGTSYTFEIRAIGANGVAGAWASGSATPSGPPAAPTGVTATATSPHDASVTWAQISPTNGTTVAAWRVTTVPASTTQTVYSPAATLSGLNALSSYTVVVVAIGANGFESAAGSGALSTPNGPPPGPLTGLNASGGGWYQGQRCPNPAQASWDPVPGADGYTVDIGGWQSSSTVSTSWTGAPPVGSWTITVTPYNLYGTGASMTDTFTMADHGDLLCP